MNSNLVYGVGVNDADYVVRKCKTKTINGKRVQYEKELCPFYNIWVEMMRRCFSEKEKLRHPVYKDVTCCEEWKLFSNFKSWMEQQDWEGKQLDKDLLVRGNRIYSPETCCFVPAWINSCILDSAKSRGEWPLGVVFMAHVKPCRRKRFRAEVNNLQKTRSKHLGVFETSQEAHRAYQLAKAAFFEDVVALWAEECSFNTLVADALLDRAWSLRLDYQNNRETLKL